MKNLTFTKKSHKFNFLPYISFKFIQHEKRGRINPQVFDSCTEAFITGKKLKLSKFLIIILTLVVIFQFGFFAAPTLAAEAVARNKTDNLETEIILANGAILSEKETQLVQQELIVIEHEPITDLISQESLLINEESVPVERKPVHINTLVTLEIKNPEFIDYGVRTITSYNSEAAQTDSSPCTTANMFNVCEHGIEDTIAANFLPFGTKVRIPDLFGDRVFIVRDRMNQRYPNRVDIWMINKSDSVNFGVKRARIEVIQENNYL